MKKHSTANILLVELVIVILFFMLCVATLVEVLGLARNKSMLAQAENAAMLRAEEMDSRLRASEDYAATLEEAGFSPLGDSWALREADYTILVTAEEEKTEAGVLRTLRFAAEQPDGTALFDLPTLQYIPEEANAAGEEGSP